MKNKLLNAFVIALILFQAVAPIGALAAVSTDQADYTPGSIVTISGDNSDGAGYLAGETVHVDVSGPNGYTAACDGIANDNGAWSWFMDERVIVDNGRLIVGSVRAVGRFEDRTNAGWGNVELSVLDLATEKGIRIPTLCHDPRLEPFASCYLCVVKVQGARTLLPACSTKVAAGMVVETSNPEIRRSRKAALELMLSNHYADCIGPCQLACPAGIDIQGYIALAAIGKYKDAIALIKENNPLPSVCGRVCTRPCEVKGCRRSLLDEAVGIDYIKRYLADLDLGAGVLRVWGKGAKERLAFLGKPAKAALKEYLPQRRAYLEQTKTPEQTALFINRRGGRASPELFAR